MKVIFYSSFLIILFQYVNSYNYDYSDKANPQALWSQYKLMSGKTYRNGREDYFRYMLWMENYYFVKNHNELAAEKGYTVEMNHFCDRTNEELGHKNFGLKLDSQSKHRIKLALLNKKQRLGSNAFSNIFNLFSRTQKKSHKRNRNKIKSDLPESINWVEKGFVTSVKDQGVCGACWSFVTTGALESHVMIKNAKWNENDYSEQNLMDCSLKYGNEGCDGGLMSNAFKYIRDNNGVEADSDYPYRGKITTCRTKQGLKGPKYPITVSSYKSLPINENVLQKYVALKGPIAVGIDGNHKSFIMYKSGVYYDPICSSRNLNHAILVVGYGTNNLGQDYWLIKNSWGKNWGEQGYGKIARNRNNHCGIASLAGYPILG